MELETNITMQCHIGKTALQFKLKEYLELELEKQLYFEMKIWYI